MNEVHDMDEFYDLLKKRKSDYVITGSLNHRILFLTQQCRSDREQFIWYLGGLVYWLSNWRADKVGDKKTGISKLERRIIRMLQNYEISSNKDCLILVAKEI